MHTILTANQQYIVRARQGYRSFVELEVANRWPGATVNWTTAGEPLRAWVNRASWAVNCDGCKESLVAEPDEPYFCPNCLNSKNGYLARPVAFPAERAEIERLLLLRGNPDMMTWLQHETVADLRRQNIEHGDPT